MSERIRHTGHPCHLSTKDYLFSLENEYGASSGWIPRCLLGLSPISISKTPPFIISL